MRKLMTAALAGSAIVGSIVGAGTAQASASDFLQDVQENIPYVLQQYGSEAVL